MTEFSAVDLSEDEGMQWKAVDSSQISEIGYESGAEYPLGIKFTPNKKQKAAGEPGSEYHYKNITPELHAEFMESESIGSFFGTRIKSRPDLYPYVKVEAGISETLSLTTPLLRATENPTEPEPKKSSHSSTGKTTTTPASEPMIESPSTALTVIDTMADDLLFTPGAVTDAQLAAGREWYLTEAKKYDISTEKARTELKRFARPLQKLRTGIEARAKELTGATKRKIAAIDAEKRRLVGLVGGIETEVLESLTTWEQDEEARKTRLATEVKRIGDMQQPYQYVTSEALVLAIAQLNAYDTSTMQEYKVSAESAIAASLRALTAELVKRQEAEAAQAELAELRKKQAERDEADRIAEQKRQDDARIDAAAEKLAAEKIQAAIDSAKAEIEIPPSWKLDMIAPQPAPDYLDCTNPKFEELTESDRKPEIPSVVDDMPVTTVKSLPIAGMVETREQAFNREAIAGLTEFASVDRQSAIRALTAIAKGLVPHITITY